MAIALLCQIKVNHCRGIWWFLMPLNVLLMAATVLLGIHDMVDALAGVVLVVVLVGAWLGLEKLLRTAQVPQLMAPTAPLPTVSLETP